MKYNDLGLHEFWIKLLYDDHFKLSDSEMYSYIKHKTDNLNFESFCLLRKDVNYLSGAIRFVPPKEITNDPIDKEITLIEFHEKYIMRPAYDNHLQNNKHLSHDELLSSSKTYLKKQGSYANIFINEYDAKMKMMEVQCFFKEYNFGFTERYRQVIRFSELIWDIYEQKFLNQLKTKKNPTLQTKPVKDITFDDMFYPGFQKRLDEFFTHLRISGYIDDNGSWIIKQHTNEPAKLFHYLKEKKVLNITKFNPSIKCFYAKFNCEVVEKNNGSLRSTTRKNAKEAEFSVDEEQFDKILLTWINKK